VLSCGEIENAVMIKVCELELPGTRGQPQVATAEEVIHTCEDRTSAAKANRELESAFKLL
jgi:hypothetical protein